MKESYSRGLLHKAGTQEGLHTPRKDELGGWGCSAEKKTHRGKQQENFFCLGVNSRWEKPPENSWPLA